MTLEIETAMKAAAWEIYREMDKHRFNLLCSGRRFGKTQMIGYKLRQRALKNAGWHIGYIAPTLKMARELMWGFLQVLIDDKLINTKNKTNLCIQLVNGAKISLWGAKEYGRIRGQGFNDVWFDEAAFMPGEVWTEVIQATLATTKGSAAFVSTPFGKANWFYDMYISGMCRNYIRTSIDGGWIDDAEIERIKRNCDEKTFRQEYLASFETTGNAVYYMFEDYVNMAYKFNPSLRTVLAWDFNINPLSTIVLQEIGRDTWCAVKEFVIPNQNTESQCEMITMWLDSAGFAGTLEITGDHAGNQHKTSAVSKTDYTIIERHFKNYRGYVRNTKPTRRVKDRVNALNGMFRNMAGEQRLYINFADCPKLVRDLRIVGWKANGIQIDKKEGISDPSDALSYFPYNYYSIEGEPSKVYYL